MTTSSKQIYYADLHLHSKYSRATSKKMVLEEICLWSAKKGINVVATADFTHPEWFYELKKKLKLNKNGLYTLGREEAGAQVYFIPSTEIALIYSQNKKVYRIHLVVVAPNLDAAEELNQALGKVGNLKSDGRPILGLSAKELARIIFSIDAKFILIPAHIWTPWFSLFGARSGFDSIEECFAEQSKKIFALETGLSSDPAMNWQWSKLDRFQLVSNSDAHSLEKIGREANAFQGEISFENIYQALKTGKNFQYTIEFYPEEGKYHYTGHRACAIRLAPAEAIKNKGICPKCKKPLTTGVAERIAQLADRSLCCPAQKQTFISPPAEWIKQNQVKKEFIPYKNLIPLSTILSSVFKVGEKTKLVQGVYDQLLSRFQNEIHILLHTGREELESAAGRETADAILSARQGRVKIEPGFDGEYGKVEVKIDRAKQSAQGKLF